MVERTVSDEAVLHAKGSSSKWRELVRTACEQPHSNAHAGLRPRLVHTKCRVSTNSISSTLATRHQTSTPFASSGKQLQHCIMRCLEPALRAETQRR